MTDHETLVQRNDDPGAPQTAPSDSAARPETLSEELDIARIQPSLVGSDAVGRVQRSSTVRLSPSPQAERSIERVGSRRLVVGPADDRYEREADAVAGQVVRTLRDGAVAPTDTAPLRLEAPSQTRIARSGTPVVQRAWEEEKETLASQNYNWFTAVDTLAHDVGETREASERKMANLIKYRASVVNGLIVDTLVHVAKVMGQEGGEAAGPYGFATEQFGWAERNANGYVIRAFAAGSTNLTSDYDVTFACPKMPHIESVAVAYFNDKFRAAHTFESGVMFDTNVYTSGFMPASAKEVLGPGAEIEGDGYVKKDQLHDKEGRVGKTDKHQLQLAFSVLPIRQFFGDDESVEGKGPSGYYDFVDGALSELEGGLSSMPPQFVSQAINDAMIIFVLADKLHDETSRTISEKTEEMSGRGDSFTTAGGSEGDKAQHLDMLVRNTLYEDQLAKVSVLLKKITDWINEHRTGEPPSRAQILEYEKWVSELQLEQGKALVYANEAYFSGGPAVHVVLGMQAGDKNIKLGRQQQLQSLLMNIGYKLDHYEHKLHEDTATDRTSERRTGRATYATAKYGERIADVVGGTGHSDDAPTNWYGRKKGRGDKLRSKRSEGAFQKKPVDLALRLGEEHRAMLAEEIYIVKNIKSSKTMTPVEKEIAASKRHAGRDAAKQKQLFLEIAQKSFAPYYLDKYSKDKRLWAKPGSGGGSVASPSVEVGRK